MPRRLVDLRQHASGVILLPSVNQHVFPFGGSVQAARSLGAGGGVRLASLLIATMTKRNPLALTPRTLAGG